jgi:hypothetical protein
MRTALTIWNGERPCNRVSLAGPKDRNAPEQWLFGPIVGILKLVPRTVSTLPSGKRFIEVQHDLPIGMGC